MPGETVPKEGFTQQVADAYKHLYDLVYLRAHPLADVLIPDPSLSRKEKAWRLHHLLLEVIADLRPEAQGSVLLRQWRRHRLVVLRYVKALEPGAVADELMISQRHYYREHKAAIKTLAGILWDQHTDPSLAFQHSAAPASERAPLDQLELLRLEAARTTQDSRYARVDVVIQGVLSLLQDMLCQHHLAVDLALPEGLPGVAIDESLLRQALLGMLGHLIKQAEQATIQLAAKVRESEVRLSVQVEPAGAVRAAPQAEVVEQLSAIEEMTTLAGACFTPLCVGESTVGFDIRLPVAERAVLVVDDNEDVLRLFRSYLIPHRYRVVTAQTARDGLRKARQMRPYAITLDLMMPEQDGWDLLQTLLNQPDTNCIPIIVCSVLKQKELALSLGATAFLPKPVSEQDLLSALAALDKSSSRSPRSAPTAPARST
jgi:CheY-like chemotaxis protein